MKSTAIYFYKKGFKKKEWHQINSNLLVFCDNFKTQKTSRLKNKEEEEEIKQEGKKNEK